MNSSETVITITIENGVQETVPFVAMTSEHNTFDVNPALTHAISNPDIAQQCLNRQPETTAQIAIYVKSPTCYRIFIMGTFRFSYSDVGVYQF